MLHLVKWHKNGNISDGIIISIIFFVCFWISFEYFQPKRFELRTQFLDTDEDKLGLEAPNRLKLGIISQIQHLSKTFLHG